jgi:hypothetical protein
VTVTLSERLFGQEVGDEVEDRALPHDEALIDGLVADGLRQTRFADAGGPTKRTSVDWRTRWQAANQKRSLHEIDGLNRQSTASSS